MKLALLKSYAKQSVITKSVFSFGIGSLLMLFLVVPSGRAHAAALQPKVSEEAEQSLNAIVGNAMMNGHVYEYLEELSDTIGGRVTGTPQAQQAVDWASKKMKAIGLEKR